jgi:S-(hydroxymethyl)glutathione dehydrogenase/alcohol dehydrogenase
VPGLVDKYLTGELPIDHYITHEFNGVESIDGAMHLLHEGACLRAVIKY